MTLRLVLFMAIALANQSSFAEGTTSLSIAYPASISAGDMLVLAISGKTTSLTTQPTASGFSGAGDNFRAATAGSNYVAACILVKEATGSESGNLAVTLTDWVNAIGNLYRFTNGTDVWDVTECAAGNDTFTVGTPGYSVALDTNFDPPDMQAGDYYLSVTGADQLAGPTSVFSNFDLIASGLTTSFVSRDEAETELGDGSRWVVSRHTGDSGSSLAEPAINADVASIGDGVAATILLRLREGDAVPGAAMDWLHYFRQYSGGQA